LIDKSGEVGSKSAEEKCGEVAFWGELRDCTRQIGDKNFGFAEKEVPSSLTTDWHVVSSRWISL
jgi:hypothetical protein